MLTIAFNAYTPYLPSQLSYVKGQLEEGEGGFLHWQVVAVFRHSVRLSSVRSLFGTAHAEIVSDRDASLKYVEKPETSVVGTQFELGTRPRVRSDRRDWESTLELARAGEFDAIDAGILVLI